MVTQPCCEPRRFFRAVDAAGIGMSAKLPLIGDSDMLPAEMVLAMPSSCVGLVERAEAKERADDFARLVESTMSSTLAGSKGDHHDSAMAFAAGSSSNSATRARTANPIEVWTRGGATRATRS